MSGNRTSALLLRLYPPAWRTRYGEELEALILETSSIRGGGSPRVPWKVKADVALAGSRERLRAAGLAGDGAPAGEQARSGSLLVLCAWVAFAVAGAGVSKLSEHWQDVTPAGSRGLPAGAFEGLLVAAATGSALVLCGIALALPGLVRYLRGGGWPTIRRRVLTAALLTSVMVAATIGLAAWAHGLSVHARNGGDPVYSGAFVAWALLVVACLTAWTTAAVATARRLSLPRSLVVLQARLAFGVAVAMAVMTTATVTWWAALAHTAPWALSGGPAAGPSSPLVPQLVAYASLMALATSAGMFGAVRALRGCRR